MFHDRTALDLESIIRLKPLSDPALLDHIFKHGGRFNDIHAIGVARYRGLIVANVNEAEAYRELEKKEKDGERGGRKAIKYK